MRLIRPDGIWVMTKFSSLMRQPQDFVFCLGVRSGPASKLPLLLEKRPDLGMAPNDDGVMLRMRGEARQQLLGRRRHQGIRRGRVPRWLEAQVERVGTVNFPEVARRERIPARRSSRVTIGADGRLLQSLVRRSSGHAEIDEAAMRILKLAAPYDPFPGELAARHDEIRIAYEWQFLGGSGQGSSVYYADPTPPRPRLPAPHRRHSLIGP